MFPVRDHNSARRFPLITIILILINVIVFLVEVSAPDTETFISKYALIPQSINFTDLKTFVPFFTSMFLHGGWFHLISNMWFLWVFGDNIEAALSPAIYLIFYLFCGLVAGLLQYLFSLSSSIPMLGASGAIAGILGAYIVFFPQAKIDTYVIGFGSFFQQIQVPASFMLGYWFILQIFSGVGSIGINEGGVAWWAHIGGFAAGYFLAKLKGGEKNYYT